MHEANEHITITQAANIAPGRPSTACVWRWCRKGVLARNGQRVRLQHIRAGSKIFTTRAWLEEFGRNLADSDTRYFELAEAACAPRAPRRRSLSRIERERQVQIDQASRELTAAGY